VNRASLRTLLGVLLTVTVLVVAALSGGGDGGTTAETRGGYGTTPPAVLPVEGVQVLRQIRAAGPFPFRQDGATFGNREGLLPDRPRGYYREYTVPTPGSPDRGARRIVTGGDPPVDFFYTDDHYDSFVAIPERERP